MSYGTDFLGSGGQWGTDFAPAAHGFIHNPVHEHLADQVTIWTPPTLVTHSSTLAHTANNVDLPPQTHLLEAHTTHQTHRTQQHFFRFDFVWRAQPNLNLSPGQVLFHFSEGARPVGFQGFSQTTFALPEVENLSQGLFAQGFDSAWLGHNLAGFGFYFQYLSFTRTSSSELPIVFDFVENLADQLLIHVNRLNHSAQNCNVGLQIPLTIQGSAQAHAADQAVVVNRAVLQGLGAIQGQTADQPRIRHNIQFQHIDSTGQTHQADHTVVTHRSPARAAGTTHAHVAEQLSITHTSPLALQTAYHGVTDSLQGIRNWDPLFPDDTLHDQVADQPVLVHTSPLVISAAWHYHRAQRLNFLPEGWVFRAEVSVPEHDREAQHIAREREAFVPVHDRLASVEPVNRVLVVPEELREAVVPEHIREAVVVGRNR